MGKSIIFRLITGNTPATWSISGGQAIKEGKGVKQINYYPGVDSHFVEDNKENDLKPETVVFRYNDILSDPATEIIVPEESKVLIAYLKAHPSFGKHYDIHDEDLIATKNVKKYDDIEKALALIKTTEPFKLQAMALAIVGQDAFGLSAVKCSAALKNMAINNPSVVIAKFESEHYESTFLSALAFFSGIVKENNVNSAVIWNDDKEGQIIPLAKGERGLDKLGEFLGENSDESRLVLQEIGSRVDKHTTIESTSENSEQTSSLLSEKDAEIAELRAQLAKKNDNSEMTLGQAQEAFQTKFKKALPPNQKNNIDWLKARLAE